MQKEEEFKSLTYNEINHLVVVSKQSLLAVA